MGYRVRRPGARFAHLGRVALLVSVAGLCSIALSPSQAQNARLPPPEAGAVRAQAPKGSVGGMGDVNIYPKRIVINERQRIATVGLFNRTSNTGDYEINVSDMAMTADGRLVDLASITDPAARQRIRAASTMVRWSPRRVTLAAYEAQTIRLMARVPPETQPGEYRTHFSATAVPPASAGTTIEQATGKGDSKSISVTLVPRFGISIPVIVRIGQTTLTVGLRDMGLVTLPSGGKALQLTLLREGTRSAFGDIAIKAPGNKKPIAEIKGIGIYPEVDSRTVQVPFDALIDPRLYARGAKLTVTYTDDDFAPGNNLARQEFTVP